MTYSTKQKKTLDKYTFGDTPAAIYLADVLNHTTNPLDAGISKHITTFKDIFKQLVNAHEKGHISTGVVANFIHNKKIALDIQMKEFLSLGYTPLVVNLYSNMVNADMKQFNRKAQKLNLISKSAEDRARGILKQGKQKYANQKMQTYGRVGTEQVAVEVEFNQHGLPQVKLDKSAIKDEITSETLMEKSIARLTRLGKLPYQGI